MSRDIYPGKCIGRKKKSYEQSCKMSWKSSYTRKASFSNQHFNRKYLSILLTFKRFSLYIGMNCLNSVSNSVVTDTRTCLICFMSRGFILIFHKHQVWSYAVFHSSQLPGHIHFLTNKRLLEKTTYVTGIMRMIMESNLGNYCSLHTEKQTLCHFQEPHSAKLVGEGGRIQNAAHMHIP